MKPIPCDPPPPGRYETGLLWFFRGHKLNIPFGFRENHPDYLDHDMKYIQIYEDGDVFIRIRQPPWDGNDDWSDMNLAGKLIQCREQDGVMELVVEDCGKFYMKKP